MRISLWMCFLQQSLCSAVVLSSAGRLTGLPRLRRLRLTACALLGGLCGTLSLMLAGPIRMVCLPAVLLLPRLAWPGLTLSCLLHVLGCQLLLMWLLSGVVGTGAQYLPAALMLAAALTLLHRLPAWRRRSPDAQYAALEMCYHGKTLRLTALVDSGNLLRDSVTGLPVIVLSQSAAQKLTGAAPSELLPGMRCLPVRTAAGPACMTVFHPDSVRITIHSTVLEQRAIAAVSSDPHALFSALIPLCLCSYEEVTCYDDDL